MKETEAKELLNRYIESWLLQDKTLFLESLSTDIVYSECYGPIYSDIVACEKWFDDWNKESKVNLWKITDFAFDSQNNKIAFEWFFECNYKGKTANFSGSSFMKISNNKFISINEYKTESKHYYPYNDEQKKTDPELNSTVATDYTIEYKWPNIDALIVLFRQTTWAKNRLPDDLSLFVDNSDIVLSVYDNSNLIGFGRIITDDKYRGLLDDIIVDEKYRSKGIGRVIVNMLLKKAENIEEIFLNTGKDHQIFYEKFGFAPYPGLTMVKRQHAKRN